MYWITLVRRTENKKKIKTTIHRQYLKEGVFKIVLKFFTPLNSCQKFDVFRYTSSEFNAIRVDKIGVKFKKSGIIVLRALFTSLVVFVREEFSLERFSQL